MEKSNCAGNPRQRDLERRSDGMPPNDDCPLCDTSASSQDNPAIAMLRVDCPVCGLFYISTRLLEDMALVDHWNVTRTLLAQALHRALKHAVVINRDFKTLQDIMEAIGTPDRSREG
jgi:hypothetical protein